MAAPRLMLTKQLDWHLSQMSAADTGGRFVQFSGNQKAVCAKSSGRVVQFVNEGANDLALRCDGRSTLQRMDEMAHEMTEILHVKTLSNI